MNLAKQIVPALLMVFFVQAAEAQTTERSPPEKKLPMPGEVFRVEGRTAFVIAPDRKTSDGATPWVWYAPTLHNLPGTEERWMFERFTRAGIAIAGIDVGESYGSPDGRNLFSTFHREPTGKRGFASKPVLLGRSRGGLMMLAWAVENSDKVGGFAGIYPVCNTASYPGVTQASGADGRRRLPIGFDSIIMARKRHAILPQDGSSLVTNGIQSGRRTVRLGAVRMTAFPAGQTAIGGFHRRELALTAICSGRCNRREIQRR